MYVKYLLSTTGVQVNIKNKKQQTPLMVATTYDVITLLQKYASCYEEYPVHNFSKVILCGDTGAGKSSLAKVKRIKFAVFSSAYETLSCKIEFLGLLFYH